MKKNKDFVRVIAMSMCALLLLSILVMFTGCAEAEAATTKPSEHTRILRTIIFLPDGEKIEGEAESWVFRNNGRVIVRMNGVKYSTHISNMLLIEEE